MLDRRRARRAQDQFLKGDVFQTAGHGLGEFARPQQKVQIAGAPEPFIANGESLVQQEAAWRHGRDDVGQDRPVKVVGHHDQIESLRPQRPGVAALKVGPQFSQSRRVGLPVGIDVHGRDAEAMGEKEPAMPTSPGGDVEGPATGSDQGQKTQDPRRGFLQVRQSCAIYGWVDMILYDLKCGKGHVFEAWFRDGDMAERQIAGRKLSCPDCGATKVSKAPMAPRIGKSAPLSSAQHEMAVKAAELRKGLKELRAKVEANCDYVGGQFAEEARKIHYGETEERGIYGETSDDEARDLAEEGVPFARIPWLPQREN